MDIFETIKSRRAVHNFLPNKEITDEQLRELFEYVALTPSGYNIQPWRFVVVRERERLDKLSEIAFNQKHVAMASAAVIVLGNTDFDKDAEIIARQWQKFGYLDHLGAEKLKQGIVKVREIEQKKEMAVRNVGLVSMTLMLAAEGMGLATCPMMGFSKWQIAKFLDLPENLFPGMLILLGYKNEKDAHLPRLPRWQFEEMVKLERWN